MPTATDGLVQVSFRTTYNNTESFNIFYYWNQNNTPVADMINFGNAWDAVVMPEMASLFSANQVLVEEKFTDVLGINVDYARQPSVLAGTQVGEQVNNFSCLRIDLMPSTKETGRGYKRIGGLVETNVAGNGLTTGFRNSVITNAAVFLDSVVVDGDTYVPVIYGRPTPANPTRSIANPVTGFLVPNVQTTQGTRKRN